MAISLPSSPSSPLLLPDIEDLISRTILVGVFLSFRKLTLQALHHVLGYRIPFLLSTIKDFKVSGASVQVGGASAQVGGASA